MPTIAYASYSSGGTRRWKYLKLLLLNSDWPVWQTAGMWLCSRMGITLDASSDVQPITIIRLELLAIICRVAGTASAGSPLVSNCLQLSWWPITPPAALMARVAGRHAAKYAGPSAASGPVNGARMPTTRGELLPL